jgi:integrase
MSVYKPKNSSIWLYDFVHKGRRFHGSTGQKTKRAAESVERKFRQDAAEGRLGDAAQLTLDQAAGKWWEEHGKHRGDAVDTERRVNVLLTLIPATMKISEITTATVSDAIQRRRAITFKKGKDRPDKDGKVIAAKAYLPSNATVNRDVIQTLRPILRRAARIWGAKGLPEIAWDELALPVPRESVRVYSRDEQDAWLEENGPTAALALRLLLRYGLRFGELFFHPDAYQAEGQRLSWMKGRKFDVPHTVPLLAEDAREVAARVTRAKTAGLDTIWYVEVLRDEKVELEPMSYYGLQARLRSSSKRAKIKQGRVIHGARHHAGTTIQRATGNMKVTQRLLGHVDPKSTHRYVHAMDEDVRAGLENVEQSRTCPEAAVGKTPQSQVG